MNFNHPKKGASTTLASSARGKKKRKGRVRPETTLLTLIKRRGREKRKMRGKGAPLFSTAPGGEKRKKRRREAGQGVDAPERGERKKKRKIQQRKRFPDMWPNIQRERKKEGSCPSLRGLHGEGGGKKKGRGPGEKGKGLII